MARGGANRASLHVKRRYFELIRQGLTGSAASMEVGVSLSCGSLWVIDAGSVQVTETVPINFIAARTCPIWRTFYEWKRREGKSHKQALIALG